ncbi:MAG: hypothetical protein SWQ30_01430 [Thermodesulfobacteriota bacterium]|nr:hypothetical protein [Thermodesulfobacteriota bacterium]
MAEIEKGPSCCWANPSLGHWRFNDDVTKVPIAVSTCGVSMGLAGPMIWYVGRRRGKLKGPLFFALRKELKGLPGIGPGRPNQRRKVYLFEITRGIKDASTHGMVFVAKI